jgi:hypothetical protein
MKFIIKNIATNQTETFENILETDLISKICLDVQTHFNFEYGTKLVWMGKVLDETLMVKDYFSSVNMQTYNIICIPKRDPTQPTHPTHPTQPTQPTHPTQPTTSVNESILQSLPTDLFSERQVRATIISMIYLIQRNMQMYQMFQTFNPNTSHNPIMQFIMTSNFDRTLREILAQSSHVANQLELSEQVQLNISPITYPRVININIESNQEDSENYDDMPELIPDIPEFIPVIYTENITGTPPQIIQNNIGSLIESLINNLNINPNIQVVQPQLASNDNDNIETLMSLGFERNHVIQVYLLSGKDIELTANILLR